MHFIDKTLLAFADPATAAAVFSPEALKAVVAASYGVPAAGLSGVPAARFDRLEFAPYAGQATTEVAADHHAVQRGDAVGPHASGLAVHIDVLWTGAITVSATFPRAAIAVERVGAPDLANIDAAIAAPVPTDPAALEAARRAVVLARLRAMAQNPDAVTEASLDAWLASAEIASVADFIARAAAATVPIRQFVLSFAPLPGTAASAPVTFPVAAAAMIRDVAAPDFRLADLMQASRGAQARLAIEGLAPKPGGEGLSRGRAAILWLVDATWFDDADWPGGTSNDASARRAERIATAASWLATQGVALVPVNA